MQLNMLKNDTNYFAMGDYKHWTQGPEDWGSWQGPKEGPKDPRRDPRTRVPEDWGPK